MFWKKDKSPELTDDQIRDLAIELIVNQKPPESAGLKRKVRSKVEKAINQITYEAVLKEKITSGQLKAAELAMMMFDEIIDYKPEGKKHIEEVGGFESSRTRHGGDPQWETVQEAYDEIIPAEANLNITNIQKYKSILLSLQHPDTDNFKSELASALRLLATNKPDFYNVFRDAMEKVIAALGLELFL